MDDTPRSPLTDEEIRTDVAQEIRSETADADMDDADSDTDDTSTATPTTRTRGGGALRAASSRSPRAESLAEHWSAGRSYERDEPALRRSPLGVEVERLVTSGGLRFPIWFVKASEQLAVRDYTTEIPWRPSGFTGTADVDRVLDEWERGATIVLQGSDLHRPELGAFCRSLERTLGHPAQVNAYYTLRARKASVSTTTPMRLRAAGVRREALAGLRASVRAPVAQPSTRPRWAARASPFTISSSGRETCSTCRGGWLHEALTSDSDSLHLTVGVNVVTGWKPSRGAGGMR